MEIIYLGFCLFFLYSIGLLENRGGKVFLFFIILIFFIFKYLKARVYYRAILFGVAILVNGLLTFQGLSQGEIFFFHFMFKEKYATEKNQFTQWDINTKDRIIRNTEIPLEITLGEGLYFHSIENLDLKEKTGSGEISGIISSAEKDPNAYPYIRIFIIDNYRLIDENTIKTEFEDILNFESKRGDLDSIQFLSEHSLENRNDWKGLFWSFFDLQRPHYCKAGFYFFNLKNGNTVILDIREGLLENSFHEENIQKTLESFK